MALVRIISPRYFEVWDYRNPDDPGIGGSETMHCELAWRLAALGHEVHSYVPRRPDTTAMHRGVSWHDLSEVDYAAPGVFILVRGFPQLHAFPSFPYHAYHGVTRRIWCVFQDIDEGEHHWREQAMSLYKIDRVITLCTTHETYLKTAHPQIADKVVLSRNGIRGELIDRAYAICNTPRQPHRLMYASSPDRGLYGLLHCWSLIRWLVPDAELHIYYGFDNMEKLTQSPMIQRNLNRLKKAVTQPGVVMHGRLGQAALYQEWMQASVMCAPTNFRETGYITLMEAQALGAIPIVNPIWAAKDNLLAGIAIEGDGEESTLTLKSYAMAAVHLLQHGEELSEIRTAMMLQARKQFDWQGVALQYDQWLRGEAL